MKMRAKISVAFTIIQLLILSIAGVGYMKMNEVSDTYSFLLEDKAKKAVEIKELDVAVKEEMAAMMSVLNRQDAESERDYETAKSIYQKKFSGLLESFQIPEARALLEEVNDAEIAFRDMSDKAIGLRNQNKDQELKELLAGDVAAQSAVLSEKVKALSNFQDELLDKSNKETAGEAKWTKIQLLILGAVALITSVSISIVIGRTITKPTQAVAKAARRIAGGDLTGEEIHVKNKDEIGDMARAFNAMSVNLRTLLRQVGLNSTQVASSAEELSASAEQTSVASNQVAEAIQQIASGAESQGQGAVETAEALKEMTEGIHQMASTASSVSELAVETSREANIGHESLQKVIHQMDSIHHAVDSSAAVVANLGEHSKQIGDIIDAITSIADQTNLLALNAAIESARAGEHGRGFAVVADEVRKLAEQSRTSADQIAGIIRKIQGDTELAVQSMSKGTAEVKVGMDVVREAEEGFRQILALIEQVTGHVQEATAVSEEMSAGAEQVHTAFEEIARIAKASVGHTQNVAASAEEQLASMEEITASSTALSKLAEDLQAHLQKFKV